MYGTIFQGRYWPAIGPAAATTVTVRKQNKQGIDAVIYMINKGAWIQASLFSMEYDKEGHNGTAI